MSASATDDGTLWHGSGAGLCAVDWLEQGAAKLPGIGDLLPGAWPQLDSGGKAQPPEQGVVAAVAMRSEPRPIELGLFGQRR